MKISFKPSAEADILAFVIEEGGGLPEVAAPVDEESGGLLEAALAAERFTGKLGQQAVVVLPRSMEARRAVLIGAGKAKGRTSQTWERIGAGLIKSQAGSGFKSVALHIEDGGDAAAAAAGAKLAAYRFDTYFTKLKPDEKPSLKALTLVTNEDKEAKAVFKTLDPAVDGAFLARDLMHEPPNVLYPEAFAERIEGLAAEGLEVDVLGEKEMTKLGMGALLGVGQGSARESKMAIMKWMGATDKSADPVVLVGKGVCFDTGGISLKPGAQMEDMKGDMGGAAAVTGTMLALARRKAAANVIGLVGLVENMPGSNAQRPGDIVSSASGQTIEIQNTDAEGRLVLCDVLWYAQKHYKPAAIVDLATLTGAIVISLGHEHAGLFCNDDKLAEALLAAGKASGDTCWRLPLGEPYDKLLKSKFADMRNIGGRAAGSITAAQFLQRFINNGTPWAHIDIAGVAWREGDKAPTDPAWASGYGPRLLDRWIADNYEA